MRTFDAVLPYLKKSYTRILGGLVMLILVDLVQLALDNITCFVNVSKILEVIPGASV